MPATRPRQKSTAKANVDRKPLRTRARHVAASAASPAPRAGRIVEAITKEFKVYSRALRGHWIVGHGAHACITLSYALLLPETTPLLLMRALALSACYMFPMFCQINFSGQYIGAEEDAISKPYRPVPAGLATREGMLDRFYVWSFVHVGVCFTMGLGGGALLWLAALIHYNFYGGSLQWFSKNVVFEGAFAAACGSSAWILVHGVWTEAAALWVAGLSVWMGTMVTCQVLHSAPCVCCVPCIQRKRVCNACRI